MSALSIYPEIDEITPGRPVLRVVEIQRPVRRRPVEVTVPAQRPVEGPVRLTRRGRTLVSLTFLALALAATIPLGGWAAASLAGGTPAPVDVVEVHAGQTLYDIAGRVAKPGQVQEMVYRIEQLNSLPSATITEGQTLAIPRG